MKGNPNSGGGDRQSVTRRVRRAFRKESWGRSVLQLAWTAGPVTYLALQGGYILSYGESAPPSLLIYFAAYTFVAGVLAIAVRLIYNATHGEDVEEGERALREVVGELPRLLLGARDAALRSYDAEDARQIAAYHVLSNPEASEYAVGLALRELGASDHLAESFTRMAVYGRHGLLTAADGERRGHQDEVEQLVRNLRASSPDLAARVSERSRGETPSKAAGRQRWEGFIERALAAGSEDEMEFLTGGDAQDVIGLAIELLVGRVFPLLVFRYRGDPQAHAAWVELATARREYRARVRIRNSRLRTVADSLADRLDQVLPSIARITDVDGLLRSVTGAMDGLVADARKRTVIRQAMDRRSRTSSQLRGALARYAELEAASEQLQKAYRRLQRASENYDRMLTERLQHSEDVPEFTSDRKQAGVWIEKRELSLPEARRRAIARDLQTMLQSAGLWRRRTLTTDIGTYRELAVGIVSLLERHLPLHRMEVQQAIELSRAPFFGGLGPEVSADVRARAARSLVDELDTNLSEYGRRSVERLFRFHGLRLTEQTRDLLRQELGLTEDDLENLSSLSREWGSRLPPEPPTVPRKTAELRSRLEKLRR